MFVNRSATGLFMFPKLTCHLYWFQIFSQTKCITLIVFLVCYRTCILLIGMQTTRYEYY